MSLSQRSLESMEKLYADEEDLYDEEVERLDSLPSAFEEGEWSREDLEWIIRWKVGVFEKPIIRHLEENDDDEVRQKVEKAVHGTKMRSRIGALTSLKGIGVPVASAILTFIDPREFPVIDVRAWDALQEAGYISEENELSEDPTVDEYLFYIGICRALASEYDVSLRKLDMALWALGGE